jgi:putative polysaccharide biosynthesis protein
MNPLLKHCRIWLLFLKWHLSRKRLRPLKSLPLRTSITLFQKGFFPDNYIFYHLDKLDKNDWKSFMNDRQMLASSMIDGEYGIILKDKLLFELVMREFACVPQNFILIRNGKQVWIGDSSERDRDLFQLVKQQKKVVLKPVDKHGGKDVRILEFKNGCYLQNGQPIKKDALKKSFLKSGNIIVSEYVRQGAFANKLYPKTVNTIRLLTMLEPESLRPFIGAAVLRIGCARSVPIDNVSFGGMYCNIELKTGRLGKGIIKFHKENYFSHIDRHPETEVIFEDQVIPAWDRISEEMLNLAAKFPILPYIAWDVAIQDKGVAIIEGNRWSEVNVFQTDRPLLEDPRVRKFFKHHNVI